MMFTDHENFAVGIDIGTTSISAVVINISQKKQVEFYTIPNSTELNSNDSVVYEQDAVLICKKAHDLLEQITNNYPSVKSIGVTGQMHGILYVDEQGKALSPLITWKDKRADSIIKDGKTYCEHILERTGEKISAGYGYATHFYNVQNNLVPKNAFAFCSIMDYIVMDLTNQSFPITHNSVAASFGLFDIQNCSFKQDKINLLGIGDVLPPKVTDEFMSCGMFKGASVSVAIGDNQASYLGSVKDLTNSVLVNIGTGSQISAVADTCKSINTDALEIRPLIKGKFLICGSALCGGASYALLEKFFREFVMFAELSEESQYEVMNKLAEKTYAEGKQSLTVNTCFSGKRHDPGCSGSILNITNKNFTPGQLVLGFIIGICSELQEMFGNNADNKKIVVASGNAVQQISVMKDVLSDLFALPVHISQSKEEASIGVALFSAVSANLLRDIEAFADFIAY